MTDTRDLVGPDLLDIRVVPMLLAVLSALVLCTQALKGMAEGPLWMSERDNRILRASRAFRFLLTTALAMLELWTSIVHPGDFDLALRHHAPRLALLLSTVSSFYSM